MCTITCFTVGGKKAAFASVWGRCGCLPPDAEFTNESEIFLNIFVCKPNYLQTEAIKALLYLHKLVYSSIIHDSQIVRPARLSIKVGIGE